MVRDRSARHTSLRSLKLAEKPNFFKLFMNDVGLLSAMYMDGIQVKILNGETEINFGSVYENAVAQELTAHGFMPTYYNSSAHGEIDFVVEKGGSALPVEVKSGKHYKRHRALAHMMDDPEFGLASAIVLDDDALTQEGNVFYAPIYMMMFLEKERLPEKMIYDVGSPIAF